MSVFGAQPCFMIENAEINAIKRRINTFAPCYEQRPKVSWVLK